MSKYVVIGKSGRSVLASTIQGMLIVHCTQLSKSDVIMSFPTKQLAQSVANHFGGFVVELSKGIVSVA